MKAFRLMTGRKPEPGELTILSKLYDDQFAFFERHAHSAEQLVRTGEHPVDTTLSSVQVAATTAVASTIMNLDEFINER